ncbi:DUF3667 domain-containing protein [Luteimonas sp. RD2P54]|uniref:DUF3667 domain-containing protein n=1 Tax=Luteimonas endophytica TaxID=3042023 RepID=A0ABT6J8A6_9GAMM|nr:DUF3667 domain-containing protein [Luteimonas endophytica]MDH5822428.1 DUF3667 domain-containing protein [Luteimonas endophytica]
MSVPSPSPDAPAPLRACENCGTALQGAFCHLCGQSEHSPTRHLGHAIEEVFESFWHLDGRIFRTLREMFVPGRVANRYLAGHRVRYVAPMRLFVILSLLTVFVAKLAIGDAFAPQDAARATETSAVETYEIDRAGFAAAPTVEAVDALRDRELERLAAERAALGADAADAARARIAAAERVVNAEAAARRRRLERAARDGADGAAGAEPEPRDEDGFDARLERNLEAYSARRDGAAAMARTLIGAAPMTLFILVPLFAALLKLLYVRHPRTYLEHVVVALYSHAFLMLALLMVFALALLGGWLAPALPWAIHPVSWLQALLLASMPLYLLLMQRRVYRQGWLKTLLKYCILGQIYLFMFLFVALGTGLYAIAGM